MDLAKFREMPPLEWTKYVDLNLYGVLHCTRAVIDGRYERGFGRIVTLSSGAGRAGIPVGRLGRPEDIGAAVAFIASDEAGWITGQTTGVNGGSLTS